MDFNEVTFHYIECIHFYSQNSESQVKKMEHNERLTVLLLSSQFAMDPITNMCVSQMGQQVGDATQSHVVNTSVNTNQTTPLNPVR